MVELWVQILKHESPPNRRIRTGRSMSVHLGWCMSKWDFTDPDKHQQTVVGTLSNFKSGQRVAAPRTGTLHLRSRHSSGTTTSERAEGIIGTTTSRSSAKSMCGQS